MVLLLLLDENVNSLTWTVDVISEAQTLEMIEPSRLRELGFGANSVLAAH